MFEGREEWMAKGIESVKKEKERKSGRYLVDRRQC